MLNIVTGKIIKNQRIVIYGPKGVGKTTFAAYFPNPVFIDMEHGTQEMDVARIDGITTLEQLQATIKTLLTEPHDYKTLVIDTVDWTEALVDSYLLKDLDLPPTGRLEDMGFGQGAFIRKNEFASLLKSKAGRPCLQDLLERMHVVLIAHSQVRRIDPPDNLKSPYDRYELKCSKGLPDLIGEWCDAQLFINYETVVSTDKRTGQTKARDLGERVIYTQHTAFCDAKNRWGLAPRIAADYELLRPFIEREPTSTKAAPIAQTSKPAATAKPVATPAEQLYAALEATWPKHEEREDALNAVALAGGWITAAQTWVDIPADKAAASLKKLPAFIVWAKNKLTENTKK